MHLKITIKVFPFTGVHSRSNCNKSDIKCENCKKSSRVDSGWFWQSVMCLHILCLKARTNDSTGCCKTWLEVLKLSRV